MKNCTLTVRVYFGDCLDYWRFGRTRVNNFTVDELFSDVFVFFGVFVLGDVGFQAEGKSADFTEVHTRSWIVVVVFVVLVPDYVFKRVDFVRVF